jgi:hypothetical protein
MPEHPRRTRSLRRRLAILVTVASFVLPPVGALGPGQLLDNINEWVRLLSLRTYLFIAWGLLIVGVTTFGVIMIRTKVKARSWVDYLGSKSADDLEPVPRPIGQRVRKILDMITAADDVEQHELRLILLTGQYSLNYLEKIIRAYPTRHKWVIRVLLLDPSAPEVDLIDESTRADIIAGLDRLARMRSTADVEEWPLTLQWRGYQHLPVVRGYLFDDSHLLLGLTAWKGVDLTPRVVAHHMHTLGRKLAHVTARDEFGRDAIESFRTWFDYLWKYASRDLEGMADASAEGPSWGRGVTSVTD